MKIIIEELVNKELLIKKKYEYERWYHSGYEKVEYEFYSDKTNHYTDTIAYCKKHLFYPKDEYFKIYNLLSSSIKSNCNQKEHKHKIILNDFYDNNIHIEERICYLKNKTEELINLINFINISKIESIVNNAYKEVKKSLIK